MHGFGPKVGGGRLLDTGRILGTFSVIIRDFLLYCDITHRLTAEEMELVWNYRHYLYTKPTALPRILQAKGHHGWDWASLADLRSLLAMWPPLHPTQAFELLLPQ